LSIEYIISYTYVFVNISLPSISYNGMPINEGLRKQTLGEAEGETVYRLLGEF